MLQTQSVHPSTLALLKRLMAFEPLSKFCLVGGTALSLIYGHRMSVDLDFFITTEFDTEKLLKAIQEEFHGHKIVELAQNKNTLNLTIDHVKIDAISHQYPLIRDVQEHDGIRMFSIEDIACMKMGAMARRGAKKDFFDMYELLQHYSLDYLLGYYKEKYQSGEIFFIVKSLAYFEDAEPESDPIILLDRDWEKVKRFLKQTVKNYMSV